MEIVQHGDKAGWWDRDQECECCGTVFRLARGDSRLPGFMRDYVRGDPARHFIACPDCGATVRLETDGEFAENVARAREDAQYYTT